MLAKFAESLGVDMGLAPHTGRWLTECRYEIHCRRFGQDGTIVGDAARCVYGLTRDVRGGLRTIGARP